MVEWIDRARTWCGQIANNILANIVASILLPGVLTLSVQGTTILKGINAVLIGIILFLGWWVFFFGRHFLKYLKRPGDYIEVISRAYGLGIHEQEGITKASVYLLMVNMSPIGFEMEPMTIDVSGVFQSTSASGVAVDGSSMRTVGFVAQLNEDQKRWFQDRRGQDVSINGTLRFRSWLKRTEKGITLESIRVRIH